MNQESCDHYWKVDTAGEDLLYCFHCGLSDTLNAVLALIVNEAVVAGRIDELKLNAYYSQGRKTDPLVLCGIDMAADEVNDRIAELTTRKDKA